MKERDPQKIADKYIGRDGGAPKHAEPVFEPNLATSAWDAQANKVLNVLRSAKSKEFKTALDAFQQIGKAIALDNKRRR